MNVPSSLPLTILLAVANEALKTRYGTSSHFVQSSKSYKEADPGNTNCTYIQEYFCSNLTKVDSLTHYVISHDLKKILVNRELCDALNVDPQVKWGQSKIQAILSKRLCQDSSFHCPWTPSWYQHVLFKHDQQTSNWLYALVFNLKTIKLCNRVSATFNEICSSHKGRITLTKIVLDEIFCVLQFHQCTQNFCKDFWEQGSDPYPRQGHVYKHQAVACHHGYSRWSVCLAWWNLWIYSLWF